MEIGNAKWHGSGTLRTHCAAPALRGIPLICVIIFLFMKLTFRTLKPIHDATCRMQLVACNKIASCVSEKLRVTSSMKLMQVNRIIVYSSQHVAWSFKGLTRSAATEYLRRHGDMYMYEYL